MMVMTAKLNLKKILLILAAAAALILSLILLLTGGSGAAEETAAPAYSANEERVRFLREQGWEIGEEPVEAGRVKVPRETSSVYERYNNLQKSQGYDLSEFAGKKAMRYVYSIRNYPGATAPVYATLLVYEDQIIGGDVTDTSEGGKIRGLQRRKSAGKPAAAETASPESAEVSLPPEAEQ